jgi:hypothetical protein
MNVQMWVHILRTFVIHLPVHINQKKNIALEIAAKIASVKAHTDRTRFGNATRIFSFKKQIKPSTDKNFTRYAGQIAKIA